MEPLILRFIRDKHDSVKDDIVLISPLSSGNYRIKTIYANTTKQPIQTLSQSNVFDYVHSVITLLIHDEDPFLNIQFEAPNAPTILLAVNKLDSERLYHAIDNLLHVSLSIWSSALP